MNVEGKLIKILTQETGVSKSDKQWVKQSIILEQEVDYNKEIVIGFFGDNINKLQNVKVGDFLSCNVNISSREYKGKYYHNIDAWSCGVVRSEPPISNSSDDLPF
tara:strand:+ start:3218 stop:3532 length:315 start_codon:yes stop_codon:yes gene_type:complete